MPRSADVEIIAHRGASRDRLENTLSAFRAALDQGADGIELDVHATRDGVVVVHHDPVVRNVSVRGSDPEFAAAMPQGGVVSVRGSDPAGSAVRDDLVLGSDPAGASLSAPGSTPVLRGELDGIGGATVHQKGEKGGSDPSIKFTQGDVSGQQMPVKRGSDPIIKSTHGVVSGQQMPEKRGSDPSSEIAARTYAELSALTLANGEQIPTLDDVLTMAAGRATVYVEVKGAAIERLVVECLARHPNTRTAVHSFDHRIPFAVGQLDHRVPLGILSSSYVLDLAHMINAAGARDLWQHTALVDQALVDTAHRAGARVVVWTENNFDHAIQLVQMGVDAICTDIPGPMRAALSDAGLIKPSREA